MLSLCLLRPCALSSVYGRALRVSLRTSLSFSQALPWRVRPQRIPVVPNFTSCFSTSLKDKVPESAPPPIPPPRAGVLGYIDKVRSEAKRIFFTYGWLAVGTYFGVWICTMSSVYSALQFGLLPSPDLNAFLNDLSLKNFLFGPEPLEIPAWGRQLAIAFVITKTTEPVRLVLVMGLVPTLVKRLPAGVLRVFGVKKLDR